MSDDGKVLEMIIKELKSGKFYSVSVDSTPDVTHSDQVTFVIHHVLPTGPEERFPKVLTMNGQTGLEISQTIPMAFLDNGIDNRTIL